MSNNAPRIPIRRVLRENNTTVLQYYVGEMQETAPGAVRIHPALGWVDIPEFVERIEPKGRDYVE